MDKRIDEIRARAEKSLEELKHSNPGFCLIATDLIKHDIPYLLGRLAEAEEVRRIGVNAGADAIRQLKDRLAEAEDRNKSMQAEVAAAMDAQRWVPVSERLPDRGAEVLVRCAEHGMFVATRTDYDGFEYWVPNECTTYWVHEPTHWMELPAPPEEVMAIEPKRGEWIDDPTGEYIACSCCHVRWNVYDNDTERFKHCPNCGARMEGGV